jgi:hypothetical protein
MGHLVMNSFFQQVQLFPDSLTKSVGYQRRNSRKARVSLLAHISELEERLQFSAFSIPPVADLG